MAEVIDLLSSSPPRSQRELVPTTSDKTAFSRDLFSFDSDEFNTTGEFEFPIVQPSKKRKLSPVPTSTRTTNTSKPGHFEIFELSSEADSLPNLRTVVCGTNSQHINSEEAEGNNEDNFRFSSSAPEPTLQTTTRDPFVVDLSSDHDIIAEDPVQSSSQPERRPKPIFTERTSSLLTSLRTTSPSSHKQRTKSTVGRSMSADLTVTQMKRFKQITKPFTATIDEIVDSSQLEKAESTAISACRQPGKSKDGRKEQKTRSNAEREAEKVAEKERKQREKEQKAQAKQKASDIAEVNKSKTNKKNSTPEMIVDMPVSLQGLSIGNQIEEYMKQLDVELTFSREEEVDLSNDVGVSSGKIVRWRRKITADYDEDLEIWKPLPQARVTREKHVLVYLKAEEFINLAVMGHSGSVQNAASISEQVLKANLDTHVHLLRTRYFNTTIIYLIEGLVAWNRKSQTIKNRAYTAAVRSQPANDEQSTSALPSSSQPRRTTSSKRNKSGPPVDFSAVTSDLTETLLLHLQLQHQPLLIHHTTSPATTASQISTFTQHLSTRPYRLAEQNHNLASASFCMTVGQIRTGATPHETYINMLQEVNRVTPSMAYGISNAGYRNVGDLVKGFRREGNLMLEDVKKSVNKDGGWSDRRLGPMVSKRLYKVFLGKDPGARDGIA